MTPQDDLRSHIAGAQRIVVKVGSSSLTQPGDGVDADRVAALVEQIVRRRSRGHQVVLVSSGAIASGLPSLGLTRRPTDLATKQAAA